MRESFEIKFDAPKSGYSSWPTAFLLGYIGRFSFCGLLVAGLLFAASLTPSLLPRPFAVQGALSGVVLAVGYGIGVFLEWLWHFMEVPALPARGSRVIKLISASAMLISLLFVLSHVVMWQNSIHHIMSMDTVDDTYSLFVVLVAFPVGFLTIEFFRLLGQAITLLSRQLKKFIPVKMSALIGFFSFSYLLFVVANGTLGPWVLHKIDRLQYQLDQIVEDGITPPDDPLMTGSPSSLISWYEAGRQGRRFIVSGPSRQDIQSFSGVDAKHPIRVYAGLRAGKTERDRAEIALQELKRTGAFERSVLVVAIPTGTGMIDRAAVDSLEYLHNGDTAIVGVQYSYLSSYVSIFAEPQYSQNTARALFDAVYDHWRELPKDTRPKLYLFGLSLGSSGSEASMDLHVILYDLIDGAVWSGPPFTNRIWQDVTENRNDGSPEWLPRYRDGSMIRFTAQKNNLKKSYNPWGPVRIVYIQYASDPITFFSTSMFYKRPDWMKRPRGPDVSPYLRWYPIVTGLQVAFDMISSGSTPMGYGHIYSPSSYIDAWVEVTQPAGWSEKSLEKLKEHIRY
ncbi:MAG: alpha/beta-hydrolase family protein [Halioglobus sp.]|nr:alpha/beta-hydrolase family protein [Halioglobus sp.]